MSKGKGSQPSPAEEYLRQVDPDRIRWSGRLRRGLLGVYDRKYRYRIHYDDSDRYQDPYTRSFTSCFAVLVILMVIIALAGIGSALFGGLFPRGDSFSTFMLIVFILAGVLLAAAGLDLGGKPDSKRRGDDR